MTDAFDLGLVQLLFEHRTAPATLLFQLATYLGEIEGYVLVVSFVFVAYDKRLAFRLSVLVLLTASLNHLLKTLIANPRPFVAEGSYAEKWAVSPAKAAELVAEYSTPSGHGMTGSAFYSYVYASVKRPSVRVAAIAAILLPGLSRPYLGVHYLEDVLLGWALGIPLALLALRFGPRIGRAWSQCSVRRRLAIVLGASVLSFVATRPLYDASPHGPPLPFVSYLGFLAGLVLAYPLEERWVGFDPRSSTAPRKLLRYTLAIASVLGTLAGLDWFFGLVADDASLLGYALRYVRYALAGIAGTLVAPFLSLKLGLAEPIRPAA